MNFKTMQGCDSTADDVKVYYAILKNIDDMNSVECILRNADISTLKRDVTIEVDVENCQECISNFEGMVKLCPNRRKSILKWIVNGHCSHLDDKINKQKSTKCGVKLVHLFGAFGNNQALAFLKKEGVPLTSLTCKFKYSALHLAIMNGNCGTVKYLASEGVDVNSKCLHQGESWVTPITIASCQQNVEILKILKTFGADLTQELRRIISTGSVIAIESLVKAGAEVNVKIDKMHTTPLHIAARRNSMELTSILIENGADVLSKDKREATPIHTALSICAEQSGVVLINELTNTHQEWTSKSHILHEAAKVKSILLFQNLFSALGLYINELDQDGNTFLHNASDKDNIEIIKFLIQAGCQLNIVNSDYATPLGIAVSKCHMDTVKILIKAGADVNSGGIPHKFIKRACPSLRKNIDNSLLIGALYHNSVLLARMLLEAGLDVHRLKWLSSSIKTIFNIDEALISFISCVTCTPESLQKTCRNVIRRHCGQRIREIYNTDITTVMKKYLHLDFI